MGLIISVKDLVAIGVIVTFLLMLGAAMICDKIEEKIQKFKRRGEK